MEVYGEFTPDIRTWIVDRFGVHRLVLSVQFSEAGYTPASMRVPTPLVPIQYLRSEIRYEDRGSHTGAVDHYFEGVPDGEQISEHEDYSFDSSFSEVPLTGHPKIGELMKKYDGWLEEGEIRWREFAPEGTKGKRGVLRSTGKVSDNVNLMYGVQSYLSMGVIYGVTRVYRRGNIPKSILYGIGLIVKNPPGNPPTPPRRNWLKMSPTSRRRGNVLQITNRFMLSGRGGVIEPVYDGSDLEEDSEGVSFGSGDGPIGFQGSLFG